MPSPKSILLAGNLYPKKHMGQNFLRDPSTAEMIVRKAQVHEDDVVLEIGPGLGALTMPLARSASHVFAVEKDRDLMGFLRGGLSMEGLENVTLINEDILNVDLALITEKAGRPLLVFGNLPYNISSMVLLSMIDHRAMVSRCIFMLQKEMARRVSACPGTKDYGRLSVRLGYCADVAKLAAVGANLFYPSPRVDSEVVEIRFTPEREQPVYDEAVFSEIIKAAFGQRRKTLKNSLAGGNLSIDAKAIDAALATAGIDGARRAETLSVEEFVALTNEMWRYMV
ncbi:MAG: ribosomal RNA small subunit methyltransferase A [Deltaproteobacteria bacterium]|nr:ribosomal RNA small subunit methyltransferase A [Deltaproteobacteria bacterium]